MRVGADRWLLAALLAIVPSTRLATGAPTATPPPLPSPGQAQQAGAEDESARERQSGEQEKKARTQDKDKKDTKDKKDAKGKKGDTHDEKHELTPAQRKLESHLRAEIARRTGTRRQPVRVGLQIVEIDARDRALVEIRARLLTELGWKVERLKGTIVSSSLAYRSLIAWVPIAKLETLAAESTVSAIVPAPKSITARPLGR